MFPAGGKLFVDVAGNLASPATRKVLIDVLGPSDPLIRDALMTIIDRGDSIVLSPADDKEPGLGKSNKVTSPTGFRTQVENDPAIAADLVQRSETSISSTKTCHPNEIRTRCIRLHPGRYWAVEKDSIRSPEFASDYGGDGCLLLEQ